MQNEAINNIRTVKHLTPPSGMSLEIIKVVADDHVDMADMVGVINKSPAITARILRCANSAYYGQRGEISTVREAIIRVLGLSITRSLALAMALNSDFETGKVKNFDERRYWFNAITTANIAQGVSHYVQTDEKPAPATVYTAGLIYNIGIQALVHCFPEIMDRIFADTKTPLGEHTRKILGLDHHDASALLARNWDLPATLSRALEARSEQEDDPIATIVHIASKLSDQIYTQDKPDLSQVNIPEDLLQRSHIAKVMLKIMEQCDSLKEMADLIVSGNKS